MKAFSIYLYIIFVLVFCVSKSSFASFTKVFFSCVQSEICDDFKSKWNQSIDTTSNPSEVMKKIESILKENEVSSLKYEIYKYKKNKYLFIEFKDRPFVEQIILTVNNAEVYDDILKLFTIKEDTRYRPHLIKKSLVDIKEYLKKRGFINSSIKVRKETLKNGKVNIYIDVNIKNVLRIKEIKISGNQESIKDVVLNEFDDLVNLNYDKTLVRDRINNLKNKFLDDGYYHFKISLKEVFHSKTKISLYISFDTGEVYRFSFIGNKSIKNQILKKKIIELIVSKNLSLTEGKLKKLISEEYESLGLFHSKIAIKYIRKEYSRNATNHYYFKIQEGIKRNIANLRFSGNKEISSSKLSDFFYKNGTTLIKRGFFDKKYVQNFKEELLKFYLKKGYVFIKVDDPRFSFEPSGVFVNYEILEGIQTKIKEFKIIDNSKARKRLDFSKLSLENNEGGHLDVINLRDDLLKIEKYYKNNGYYFASITNINSENLVTYKNDFRNAILRVEVKKGPKIFLGNIIVEGLQKTKKIVITREIKLIKGQLVKFDDIEKIKINLVRLRLFKDVSLQLTPSQEKNLYDLRVLLSERDAGIIEMSPGFRSDIGLKLSSKVEYRNLQGMNRSVLLTGRVNQRLDKKNIELGRPKREKNIFEYQGQLSFGEPYVFSFPLEFNSFVSSSKRRYYSFDADIVKVNAGFSKNFTDRWYGSLTYQLESILQRNSLDDDDNGRLRIGSLMPFISYDFRDNSINPMKGGDISFNFEFALPTFYSQNNSEREVKFLKVVSRDRFYYPIEGGTIATYLAVGYQKNFADNRDRIAGSIPRIRVFGLTGVDGLRGFQPSETVNLTNDGTNINDKRISNYAYYVSLKIEPRFFIDDYSMFGLFYDAGIINVSSFKPLKLRSSVGVSFKYLTPVGSIGVDYGFKLHRRRLSTGALERPGELHISIGFF